MPHAQYGHRVLLVIDPVEHSIRAAAGAMNAFEFSTKGLPDPVWVL